MPAIDASEQLRQMFALFADTHFIRLPSFQIVPAGEIPPPSHDLLVHDQHMTVTLERFHGRRVALRVLARYHQGNDYARMILLALEGTGEIVEFGMVRMDLSTCRAEVQAEIVAGTTPLGRILIENDVLRWIEPTAFLRITGSPELAEWFETDRSDPIFGRLAMITCNGREAVQLVEIVRPARVKNSP